MSIGLWYLGVCRNGGARGWWARVRLAGQAARGQALAQALVALLQPSRQQGFSLPLAPQPLAALPGRILPGHLCICMYAKTLEFVGKPLRWLQR